MKCYFCNKENTIIFARSFWSWTICRTCIKNQHCNNHLMMPECTTCGIDIGQKKIFAVDTEDPGRKALYCKKCLKEKPRYSIPSNYEVFTGR